MLNYKIEIMKIWVIIGLMIIFYEIVLVLGVWIFKIKNLEDDIVLSFVVLGICIIVFIFGWGIIGIEVFNCKK